MAHHKPDSNLNKALLESLKSTRNQFIDRTKNIQRQLIDKYPEGRLNDDDDGALAVSVGSEKRKVILSFAIPSEWIGFTPEQAIELAQSLIKKAKKCGLKNPISIEF